MYDLNVASLAAAEPRLGGIQSIDDVMLPWGIRVRVGVSTSVSYCFSIHIEPGCSLDHGCLWFLGYDKPGITYCSCRVSPVIKGSMFRKARHNRSQGGVKPAASFRTLHSPKLLRIRINGQPYKPSRKLADAQYYTTNHAHTMMLRRPSVVL